MKKMNLPNQLTILRTAMVPIFLLFMFLPIKHNYLYAFIIFAFASITDALDGMIARKYNLITNFGKFMDPLADKILTISAFIALIPVAVELNVSTLFVIAVVIIISRELAVTGFRILAADNKIVIAADIWGKIKTVLQMVWICYTLLFLWVTQEFSALNDSLMRVLTAIFYYGIILLAVVTFISGARYILNNRKVLTESK